MSNFVYLVKCSDGSFYAGWSTDPEKREKTHNSGKGAKYTRSRLPVSLVYKEECADKNSALRREIELKRLTHDQKQKLAEEYLANTGNSVTK